ncbi:MAG: hypothetical protein ABIJ96_05840 [Elusimicrobiota bacterium]
MKKLILAAVAAVLIIPSARAGAAQGLNAQKLAQAAYQNETQGRYLAAMAQLRAAIRLDSKDPVLYLHAARVRLIMGDETRSAGNLQLAIQRARAIGAYGKTAAKVRQVTGFQPILTSKRNQRILDLYDAVETGLLSEEEAVERIHQPEAMRDALSGLAGPGAFLNGALTPPALEVDAALNALPERSQVICQTAECARVRLEAALQRGNDAFTAEIYDEAAANYELALTISDLGTSLTAGQRGAIYLRVGISLRHMGLVNESVKLLTIAAKSLPESVEAEYELATSHNLLGEEETAVDHLKQAFNRAARAGSFDKWRARAEADENFESVRYSGRFSELVEKYTGK